MPYSFEISDIYKFVVNNTMQRITRGTFDINGTTRNFFDTVSWWKSIKVHLHLQNLAFFEELTIRLPESDFNFGFWRKFFNL